VNSTSQSEELQHLHAFCVRTLRRYIEEAERTCRIFNEVHKFPVSREVREKILQQRESENAANNDYMVARQKLFEAA